MFPSRFPISILSIAIAISAVSAPVLADDRVDPADMTLGTRSGDPMFELPPTMRLLSPFGERPAFSPDGTKIAFIGESYGDAFELDLVTGTIRNLTKHAPNNGFLRIHYLGDGSFLLLGPRTMGKDRETTRLKHVEMFWLDAAAERVPVALGHRVWEGIATSRHSNRVAWAEVDPNATSFADIKPMTVMAGTVAVLEGRASLIDVKPVFRPETNGCLVEAQDFLPGDAGLTMPCYYPSPGQTQPRTDVISVDLRTGKKTVYPTPAIYGEAEGIFPDGKHTLVECSGDRAAGMDICMLELTDKNPDYRRLTRIMDYGRWKFGNPVVSPDGRTIAMQIGPADVEPGAGQGIVLMNLTAK